LARKIIGITMGDPSGIGPEISLKVFFDKELYIKCKPLLVGDKVVLEKYMRKFPKYDMEINSVNSPKEGVYEYGTIDLIDLSIIKEDKLVVGEISSMSGDASFQYITKVIDLAMKEKIDATVTNPINKESINSAGHKFAGHTEIYGEYTNSDKFTMMLADRDFRVVHVSTHVSLRDACDAVKKDRVTDVIRMANEGCKNLGIKNPKIAVAGLNPHAGEGGLFGKEEIDEIIPAVEETVAEGINVEGPIAPDTVFPKAKGGFYDVVVAMYHDQGHIPLKLAGFVYDNELNKWAEVSGVNITLGLPIIRVSVDHGTAFDQAGKMTASELSLNNAIDYSIKLAMNN